MAPDGIREAASAPGRMCRAEGLPWIVGALGFALYAATAARTIGLPDSAIVIDAMHEGVVSSHACNHTLNNLIGHLVLMIPWGGIVVKANLLSALYGAVALGIFAAVLRAVGVSRAVAALSSAVLAVSHSMWWHGTQVENYALSIVLLNACLLRVARGVGRGEGGATAGATGAPDPWLFLIAGFALLNHAQNGALTIAAVAVTLAGSPWRAPGGRRAMVRCALAWMLGAAPFLAALLRDIRRSGFDAAMHDALGGGFQSLMFRYGWSSLGSLASWVVQQFPSPFLLFVVAGVVVLARSRRCSPLAIFAAVVFVVNTGFFAGYATWDQFAFLLPSFIVLALAGAAGAEAASRLRRRWAAGVVFSLLGISVGIPPLLYPTVPARVASSPDGFWGRRYRAAWEAYRGRYDLIGLYADPLHHDRGTVDAYIRALAAQLPRDAVLVDDVAVFYQFEFLRREEGLRPDVRVILLNPLRMEGWGDGAEVIARRLSGATNRIFFTGTNGPIEEAVAAFASAGTHPSPFPLNDRQIAWEMVPGARPASETRDR